MPTATEIPTNGTAENLAEELHRLETEEELLATRTRRLEFSNPLALLFSILAFALALGALVVALVNSDNGSAGAGNVSASATASPAAPATGGMHMSRGMTSNGMTMGAGGHGRFTPAMVTAANKGTVYVQLGDFWVAPAVNAIRAGRVTFIAKNIGMAPHELMIERAPIKLSGPGKPIEDAAQGMIDDMTTGQSGRMTVRLTPGNYVLFCNVPGHYASGQHIAFTVTQ